MKRSMDISERIGLAYRLAGKRDKAMETFEKMKKVQTFMEAERTEHGKERSVCVLDSVPSQANRIEPAFGDAIAEGKLVPRVVVKIKTKDDRRVRIQLRQRKRIAGSRQRPRLSVFRSVTHIYAQVIDDSTGQTLVSASTVDAAVKGKLAKGVKGGNLNHDVISADFTDLALA